MLLDIFIEFYFSGLTRFVESDFGIFILKWQVAGSSRVCRRPERKNHDR